MISDARAEKAVEMLRDSAQDHADAVGDVKLYEHKLKVVWSHAFIDAEGSIKDREASAQISKELAQTMNEYRTAVVRERFLRDQRQAAELTVEVWRTQNANARART